jgi:hypothetical protein
MLRNVSRADKKKFRKKKKVVRFPGITRHARKLGYSRIHLYFLLTGQRPWQPEALKRYRQILHDEANHKPGHGGKA